MPDLRAIVIEDTTIQSGLPNYREMSRAFHGKAGRDRGAHFILTMGTALAEVHRSHKINPYDPSGTAKIRAELASLIDRWIATNLPGRPGWAGPTRSIGSLADEMAAAQVDADHRREACRSVGQDDVHAVHHRLGALATEWMDLIGEIAEAQPYRTGVDIQGQEDGVQDELPQRIPGTHYIYPVSPQDPPPFELLVWVAAAVERWELGIRAAPPAVPSATIDDAQQQ
ncbi:hypothetical protein [Nocardia africana]|uniref:Uncharacterized protein n=1 Tax=Nocardia africana TaxID=134964 RepID=A0ABW6NU91_9NOCA